MGVKRRKHLHKNSVELCLVRNASNFSINQQATVYLLDHFKQQNALWGLESLSEHLIPQSSKLSNLLGKPDTKELIDFPNFNSALYS